MNLSLQLKNLIYPNKTKNRIVFKIKTGYKLQVKNGVNVPELEKVHSVLLHCNVVQNDYLQNSKLFYSFVPGNAFEQLLSIQPKALIQSKTIDYIFDHIAVWFTDQNNNFLQLEDSVSVTIIIQNKV